MSWCLGNQIQTFPFFRRLRIVLVICARSGMKDNSWFAKPRKARTSLMQIGVGTCFIAVNFFSSGLMPESEMLCQTNSISFPIPNFFLQIVKLFILHRSNTKRVLMTRSSSLLAQIMVSSTNFLAQGRPSTIMSDLQHHSSEDAFCSALRYLNFPWGNKNVVMYELFGYNASWNYPCTASSMANMLLCWE